MTQGIDYHKPFSLFEVLMAATAPCRMVQMYSMSELDMVVASHNTGIEKELIKSIE